MNACVWVFNGAQSKFPFGVFTTRELAEAWIGKHALSGLLTLYPLDVGMYDYHIEQRSFRPKRDDQRTSLFIGSFSGGGADHFHYEHGQRV